jgi:hypothetical protein
VSRESVRITFLIAALNDLDILMFDVGNANTTEKLYCYEGKEFGMDMEGKLMIIRRALYGLKSSGAAYRAHFARTLVEMGTRHVKPTQMFGYKQLENQMGQNIMNTY